VWFGGQEMANAIVDVLAGDSEPAGRLPTTFPVRLEHNPSYGNFPAEQSRLLYGERLLVGYRWYEARGLPTRFPFGHGLSYTTFVLGEPTLSSSEFNLGERLSLQLTVTNTGGRRGAEVVQCYVAPLAPGVTRPPKELKAFAKVWLEPGESRTVILELDDRAFAHWDPGDRDFAVLRRQLPPRNPFAHMEDDRRTEPGWVVEPGSYDLRVGRSSEDIAHVLSVTVPQSGP
jgi:beta-glucosidase